MLLAGRVRGAAPGRGGARAGADRPARAARRSRARCRTSSRAASSSASRSPARWSTTRPCCWPTSRPATSTSSAGAEVLRLLRAGADEGRAVVMVTHETAAAEHRRPRPDAARRAAGRGVIRDALAALRARRGRTLLAALGVLAASLVVGHRDDRRLLARDRLRPLRRAGRPARRDRALHRASRGARSTRASRALPNLAGALLPQRALNQRLAVAAAADAQGRGHGACSAGAAAT